MGLFLQNGTIKSTLFLKAFFLSLIYGTVYFFAFMFSAELVASLVPVESGGFVVKWLPPSLIALAASVPCVVPLFFARDKRIVLFAFALIGVSTILAAIFIVVKYTGEERSILLSLVSIYMAVPALWGNSLAWLCAFAPRLLGKGRP